MAVEEGKERQLLPLLCVPFSLQWPGTLSVMFPSSFFSSLLSPLPQNSEELPPPPPPEQLRSVGRHHHYTAGDVAEETDCIFLPSSSSSGTKLHSKRQQRDRRKSGFLFRHPLLRYRAEDEKNSLQIWKQGRGKAVRETNDTTTLSGGGGAGTIRYSGSCFLGEESFLGGVPVPVPPPRPYSVCDRRACVCERVSGGGICWRWGIVVRFPLFAEAGDAARFITFR